MNDGNILENDGDADCLQRMSARGALEARMFVQQCSSLFQPPLSRPARPDRAAGVTPEKGCKMEVCALICKSRRLGEISKIEK